MLELRCNQCNKVCGYKSLYIPCVNAPFRLEINKSMMNRLLMGKHKYFCSLICLHLWVQREDLNQIALHS